MITLAQRIEQLRTDAGYSRAGLASALDFPKGAFDKFETGRATPTKEQQAKIADFFSVSLFYLRGESNDPTRQEDWIDMPAEEDEPGYVPMPSPRAKAKAPKADAPAQEGGSLLDSLLSGRQAQAALRAAVLEVLRSPEGQALIAKAVHKELSRGR